MSIRLLHGDCLEALLAVESSSVDACVTDPPYELGFMGKQWDGTGIAFKPETWAAVLRVLKPGAHLLACGGTRTYHRMAVAIEDSGFEIRDCLAWLYGSGFPKSLNLGEGLGTALKPAYEPIVLARKPFKGTVAGNVGKHGTGALNIDTCRIDLNGQLKTSGGCVGTSALHGGGIVSRAEEDNDLGRWPANVCLDDLAALVLDEQSGELGGGERVVGGPPRTANTHVISGLPREAALMNYGDVGGASRFFYVAKPSREERDYGLYDLPARSSFDTVSRDPQSAGANNPRAGAGRLALLNTSGVVYPEPSWVNAVLSRRLLADTDTSRQKATVGSTTQCSDGSAWSMCWCGSPSTDPYHPAVKSIIETETSSITASRISNSSRRPHTNGCMAAACGVLADGGNLAGYAEFQSPWKRLTGTSPSKAGRSTVDAVPATSIASWLTSAPEKPNVRRNGHPTVKPVELMRWLVRLVTPLNGTVLDPFLGSGTTGMACRYELRNFIGIEREQEYLDIAERRIAAVAPLFPIDSVTVTDLPLQPTDVQQNLL